MGITPDVSLRAKLESIGTADSMVVFSLDSTQDYKVLMRSIGVLKCRGGRFGEASSFNHKVFIVGADYMRVGVLVSVRAAPVPTSEVQNRKYRKKVKRPLGTWHSLVTKIHTLDLGESLVIPTDSSANVRTTINHAKDKMLPGRSFKTEEVKIVVPLKDEMLFGVLVTREK